IANPIDFWAYFATSVRVELHNDYNQKRQVKEYANDEDERYLIVNAKRDERYNWCEENCKGLWLSTMNGEASKAYNEKDEKVNYEVFLFLSRKDAMKFKLTFGGV